MLVGLVHWTIFFYVGLFATSIYPSQLASR